MDYYKFFRNPHEKIKARPLPQPAKKSKGIKVSQGRSSGIDLFPRLQAKPVVLGSSKLKQEAKNISTNNKKRTRKKKK